jgi:DNA-binding MarR family transcriptional regulator
MERFELLTTDYLTAVTFFQKETRKRLNGELDLAFSQYLLLDSLRQHGGDQLVKEILTSTHASGSATSYHLSQMEKGGLIIRARDRRNRRMIRVCLTDAGYAISAKARGIIQTTIKQALAPLGKYLSEVISDAAAITASSLMGERSDNFELFGDAVFFDSASLTSDIDFMVAEKGLNTKEFRVLFALGENGQGMSCHDLAKKLLLHLPDITIVTNRLEDLRLIQRLDDTVDRRVVIIEANTNGYTIATSLGAAIDQLFRSVIKDSSKDYYEILRKATSIIVKHRRKAFRA